MEAKSPVPALERSMDILELLEQSPKGLSFTEIYTKLKIPKPSVLRILNILHERKYVRQENKIYKLGLKLLTFGLNVQDSLDLRDIARPYLEDLLKSTGETVELFVFDEDSLLVIDKLESFNSIRIFAKVGVRFMHLHLDVPGKVALTFLPEKVRENWLKGQRLKKPGPHTEYLINKFKKEMLKIKKDGVFVDTGEMRPEVFRMASPILDHKGELVGVVDIAGPSFRLKEKNNFKSSVIKCALDISKKLGYQARIQDNKKTRVQE